MDKKTEKWPNRLRMIKGSLWGLYCISWGLYCTSVTYLSHSCKIYTGRRTLWLAIAQDHTLPWKTVSVLRINKCLWLRKTFPIARMLRNYSCWDMQHFSLKQIVLAVVGGKVIQMWYSNGHCGIEKCLCSQENHILPKLILKNHQQDSVVSQQIVPVLPYPHMRQRICKKMKHLLQLFPQ